MTEIVNDEVSTETTATATEDAAEAIRRGYEKVAEPDKVQEPEAKVEPTTTEEPAAQTEETPPAINGEQLKDLMARVERIPELEKRLRDEGGRYGALKQSLEQLQQKIAESTTRQEVVDNTADAKELLAELRDEFPELAGPLEKAFSRVISARGGIDPGSIDKIVAERVAVERQAERTANLEEAKRLITEYHPDFWEVKGTPEFATWLGTLNPRTRARLEVSEDPIFVAEQIDAFKDWKQSSNAKEKEPTQPSKRLADAVLPTTGAKVATQKTVDPKASIRAGYERVAGKRI